ncbi:hypothetical protein HL670_01209 [Serratia plymuthica]|uniref:hypothetical protein n=1 Tax=Serratia plymuthica TaxID=82996 RepID=UPI0003453EDC|nr:hypothetical protein [Serratia plymuthica]QJW54341.1 hypothetical protein HL670_01209 [Serratia plymuthica]
MIYQQSMGKRSSIATVIALALMGAPQVYAQEEGANIRSLKDAATTLACAWISKRF